MKVSKRVKRRVAWFLSFLLIFVSVMGSQSLDASAGESVTFKISRQSSDATGTVYYKWDTETGWTEVPNTAYDGTAIVGTRPTSAEDADSQTLYLKVVLGENTELTGNCKVQGGVENGTIDTNAILSESGQSFTVYTADTQPSPEVLIEFQSTEPNPPADSGNRDVSFTDGTVSGNEITYQVGEQSVKVTVAGATISDSKITVSTNDLNAVTFTLTDYDPDTMDVKVYADSGFSTTLNVTNNTTSLANKTSEGAFPNELLKLKVEAKASNPPADSGNRDVSFTDGTVSGNEITYQVGEQSVKVTVAGATISDSKITVSTNDLNAVTFTLTDYDPDTMDVKVYADSGFSTTLNVTNNTTSLANKTSEGAFPNELLKLKVEAKGSGGNVSGESISVTASVSDGSGTIADLLVDSQRIGFESANISGSFNGDKLSGHTVSITVEYGKLIDSITINGTTYSEAANQNSATISVPAADAYTITVTLKADPNRSYTVVWAYSQEAADRNGYGSDAVVENGTIEIIQVQLPGGTTYSATQMKETLSDGSPAHEGAYYKTDNGTGYAMIKPGSTVTFKFTPAYGYQIAYVVVNGQTLAPVDANVGQFTYTMPSTNVHFQGIFTGQSDQFNLSGTTNVSGVSITNGANAASNGGNLSMTVADHAGYQDVTSAVSGSDVEQLSSMDISLANIVSKGGTNGYWSNSVTSFGSSIGVNLTMDLPALGAGETYSVVREHQGVLTELTASYNATTNTFSFDTNQFSTYTIVKKTVNGSATASPTPTATPIPTAAPTTAPTTAPTAAPTTAPTAVPTLAPTATPVPSATPTAVPVDIVTTPIPDEIAAAASGSIENSTDTVVNAYNGNLLGSETELAQRLLTLEEVQAAINGESVKVYLSVTDISASVSATDRALVEAAAGNTVIGMYLDLTLFKQIGGNAPQQIANTNGKVTICIQVPESLINRDPSVTRSYQIVRIHDGVATILDCSFDELTGSLVFETDAFSTYALIYSDDTVDESSETRTGDVPKTSDGNDIVLWCSLLALGCAGMAATDIYRRRRESRETD
ncbi:MAG: hypothetical protein ACI4SE_08145 [Lachnospiraceae bacterium]